jgi:hypothetical protein
LCIIGAWCFDGCVSLRSLSFPDSLSTIGNSAFAASGLGALNFLPTPALTTLSLYDAHWLTHLRLPFGMHKIGRLGSACRLVDISGGLWDLGAMPGRLRRFRSTAMRGPSGAPSSCLVSAWVAAELVAVGGRSGAPALPC